MKNQKGVIHLAVPLLLLVILGVAIFITVSFGIIKNPLKLLPFNIPGVKVAQPSVSLQNQYLNPFDKSAQYVNPFSGYKNPFDKLTK